MVVFKWYHGSEGVNLASVCRQLGFGLSYMWMLCHDRKFADHCVSGVLALDLPSPGNHTMHVALLLLIAVTLIALFSSLEQDRCVHVACGSEWMTVSSFFHSPLSNIHLSGVLTALFGCCVVGATWNCCCLGASSAYTFQPCTSLQCHFFQNHTDRALLSLAVTCHLLFGTMAWIFYVRL